MAEGAWFLERLTAFGERPCLIHRGAACSYAELMAAAASAAEKLRAAKVQRGSAAALCADFSVEGIAALLAAISHGLVIAPVVTRKEEEIALRVKSAGLDAVWWRHDGADSWTPVTERATAGAPAHALIEDLRQRGHPGLILFSSGTSGQPKAMLHDLVVMLESYRNRRARALRLLSFLLFDHIGGLHTLFSALASGSTLVIPDSRAPGVVAAAIARHKVSILPASPTFLGLLLMSGAHRTQDLSSLKIITYGTEPMPESLLARLREALPHARFIQTFGTSETCISKTRSRSSESLEIRIDDPGTEYRVVAGELWLRSHTRILGYLNADGGRFTEDGWFRTGDQVEELDDGYLRILGRESDVINVGGEKVFPAEIESVVLELAEVEDCMASAESNPITGQAVRVRVVAAAGFAPDAVKRAVRRHCRERLEPFKRPARVSVTDSLPFSSRYKRTRT